ncbi:hypothetical protein Tco_1418698 [Tanacetum coccineum]
MTRISENPNLMHNETRFSNLPDGDNVRVSNMVGRFPSIQCNPTTNLGARGVNKGCSNRLVFMMWPFHDVAEAGRNGFHNIDTANVSLSSEVNTASRINIRSSINIEVKTVRVYSSTIPETESDEVIKSSVENLVPIPSESEVTSDNESECDVPVNDESSPIFTTFSNPLIDSNDDFTFNTLIDSSPKFDYLLEEFFGELAHINPIPSGIEEADFDLEEEICLVKNLSYDNSSPRLSEELNAEIADTILKSLSPSPIPVEDSDSLMEEIDLFLAFDESMPPGIENDDYDSEGDIRFLEELFSNDSPPLPKNDSSNLDHFNDPSSPHPPPEPPDVEICIDFEPNTGVLMTKMVKGISEHYVLMPNILPTLPTLDPDSNFTPSHDSLGSGNKIFNPGIFIEVQSERLLSWDEFSISFICDPLSPVFDTLLPFLSENEDKVFNPVFSFLLSYLIGKKSLLIFLQAR